MKPKSFLASSRRAATTLSKRLFVASLATLVSVGFTGMGQAAALTNGWPNPGLIAQAGGTNEWSISAEKGDRMVLQLVRTSGGAGLIPRMEVFAPDGATLGLKSGVSARFDLQAAQGGEHVVRITAGGGATGGYSVYLAQMPGAFTLPPQDEGGPLTNGASHRGEIVVGDLDAWTLSASAGDWITVQVGEVTGGAAFAPMIEVFGPDGTQLDVSSGATAARVDVQAETSGTFTVLVSDLNQTGTGTYELHLGHVADALVVPDGDQGGPLATQSDIDGSIGLGDLDFWTFVGSPGDRVTLQITKLTGGANFTPLFELFGPAGERKGSAQNATVALIDAAIESPGIYTLMVSDATRAGVGDYRLNFSLAALDPLGPNVLTNGGLQTGAIIAAGQTNNWSFTASAGEVVVVRVGEITQSGTFSPRLRLRSPAGVQLATAFGTSAAEVAVTVTNSGTFRVDMDSNGTGTGTYRLSLAKSKSLVTVAPNDDGGALTNGAAHVGSIEVGELDVWTFTANRGESIAVRMGELTAALSPQLRLYSPAGALLDTSFGTAAAEVSVTATNGGTFLVVAGDQSSGNSGSGNYRLCLAKGRGPLTTSPGDEGGALTNGVTNLGSIDVGDLDTWGFTANAGQTVIARMGEVTSTLSPQLRLIGPNGALLDSGFGTVAAEVSVRATNSGRFLILAGDQSSGFAGSGNYRLTLSKTGGPATISPNDEGGAMTNGTTYVASLEAGDMDTWTVAASAGQALVIRMGEVSGTLTPQLRLYGPNGALLDSAFGTVAAEVTARATNDGAFLVVAGDQSSGYSGVGNYRLSLAQTGAPLSISANDQGGTLTNGTTLLGSIETGDIDAWIIEARSEQTIIARVGEVTAGLTPQLRLYGPDGALVTSSSGSVAAEVTATSTENGPFLLVVGDLSSGFSGSGDYRLSFAKTGEPVLISANDEGGSMTGTDHYEGMLETGDTDTWTFSARAGDIVSVNVTELVAGSPLTPQLRLYGRDGKLLRSFFGAATAQFNGFVVPEHGTYLVVVSDLSAGFGGSGTYRMTVNNLSDGLRLYNPILTAEGVTLLAVGGLADAGLTVLSSTEVNLPLDQWTPTPFNFDRYGVAEFNASVDPNEPRRFFLLRLP